MEPAAQIVRRTSTDIYAARANRIVVRHHLGRIIAVIEIVSPGNKHSRAAVREFVEKSVALLRAGVHLLVIDLFPPTPRDPHGLHKAIWDEIEEEEFQFPKGKDRMIASYKTGEEHVANLELRGVGDSLPGAPLYLTQTYYVQVPLEATYQSAWEASPEELRMAVETGILPSTQCAVAPSRRAPSRHPSSSGLPLLLRSWPLCSAAPKVPVRIRIPPCRPAV